ncbi:mucin-like protein [Ptychodera flava]|uniref:mucin-like protein n=1 Tax=Ptychodera flava TaxID=63121 RepID=UPI00396A99E7
MATQYLTLYFPTPSTREMEGYYIADCDCANGWTGRFCQEDKDACLDYPCYQGVNCTDMPAGSAEEYQCGPCPDGMVGDGIKCFDDNECLSEQGTCNQTCINTLGSYYCECRQGFHLNEDKHSCDDIDECSHHGNRCARYARCINLPGSFDCQCLPEYHGNGFVKCIEAVKYGATLVFPYLTYQDDLENQDSDEFKELAEIIEASLNKTYKALEGLLGQRSSSLSK